MACAIESEPVDERIDIVSNTPVARIKNDRSATESWRWERCGNVLTKLHWRRIANQLDPLPRNSAFDNSPALIFTEHFDDVNPASPENRKSFKEFQPQSLVADRCDQALRMEVGNAVPRLLAKKSSYGHD